MYVDLTIRNLLTAVLEDLARAARANGRSVNEEAVIRLGQGSARLASETPPTVADFRALRAEHPLPPLSLEELQRAIDEGRP